VLVSGYNILLASLRVHPHLFVYFNFPPPSKTKVCTENTNRGARLNTVDLLVKVACFVKENIFFGVKRSLTKLLSTRRSILLCFSPQ